MPRKKVECHAVVHNGKDCFRVIVPKELNAGKSARRYFDDESSGKAFAADLESERRSAHSKFLVLDSGIQNSVIHALDLMKGRECEFVPAVQFYLTSNVKEDRTLESAIAECVTAKQQKRNRRRSTEALRNALERFATGRESKLVREITVADCNAWVNAPEAKAVDTRRSRQIDLGTFFSFCLRRGYVSRKPTDGLEKITRVKKSPSILTVAQCRTVLDAAIKEHDGELLATVALQMFGGLRPYESYKVSREMIKAGHLRIDEKITKTLDVRIVRINPTLKAWLDHAFKIGSKLPAWDAPRRMTDIRRAVQPWPQDCLRHSFVTYHMESHGWEKTIEQAGHSLATSFTHYRTLTTKSEARAFWSLRPKGKPAA